MKRLIPTTKLSEERIAEWLLQAEGWSREDGKWIVKKYRFPEFLLGVEFVNQAAHIAETLNHHPMISIDYKMVTVRLTTWSAAGLTELDLASAAKIDRAFKAM